MTADEPIYEDDVFEISQPLCESVLAALNKHDGIIIDHVITSQRIYDQLRALLTSCPLHTIRVTCSVEILRQREQARGNRCCGSAEASLEYLFPKDGYEATVDTHLMTPVECAAAIRALLKD